MIKKGLLTLAALLLILTVAVQSVWAFSDLKDEPNAAKITRLEKQGIVSGNKNGHYKPKGKLTYAEGVSLIVKGFGLNIDNIRFIKEPKASDSFTNVKDDAWYAPSFIIASLNGLDIPRDVDPSAPMTREQFAHNLYLALAKTGDYAFIEMYVMIRDEADITPAYMDSIQKLLLAKIVQLDKNNDFKPQAFLTRGEAAGWLYNALQFVKTHQPLPAPGDGQNQPFPLFDVKLTVTPVNDKVNEVTVTAQAPNPGYGFTISSITFEGSKAVLHLEPIYPDKDKNYIQVITEVKQTTYVASNYTPMLDVNSAETSLKTAAAQ